MVLPTSTILKDTREIQAKATTLHSFASTFLFLAAETTRQMPPKYLFGTRDDIRAAMDLNS